MLLGLDGIKGFDLVQCSATHHRDIGRPPLIRGRGVRPGTPQTRVSEPWTPEQCGQGATRDAAYTSRRPPLLA